MAGKNSALLFALGCPSFVEMQKCLKNYVVPSIDFNSWLHYFSGFSSFATIECSQSALDLFPWFVFEAAMAFVVRHVWIGVTFAFVVQCILPRSALATFLPPIGMFGWFFATGVFASFSTSVVMHLFATYSIVSRMQGNRFVRDEPSDIESEHVWGQALGIWRGVESKQRLGAIAVSGILILVLLVGLDVELKQVVHKLGTQCRQLVDREPNVQPLVLDIVAIDSQFGHTIDRMVLNEKKFDAKQKNTIGPFHTLYCYPEQMFFNYDTMLMWQACVDRHKVSWYEWISLLEVSWEPVAGIAAGVGLSALLMICNRWLFGLGRLVE